MKWETAVWMVACSLLASLPRASQLQVKAVWQHSSSPRWRTAPSTCKAYLVGQLDTTCHAFVGETVVLPCNTTSLGELPLSKALLYWQIGTKLVHFFQKGQDSLDNQDEKFHGRTSLFLDQMKDGNLSLQISNVQLQDDAEYSCIYRQTEHHQTKIYTIKLSVSVPPRIEDPPSPSEQNQIPSRSITDVPCLALLPLSVLLLVPLGLWHF